jgi:putative transposase
VHRKVTYRLYPNATETVALERTLAAHCKVYNTLLETSRLRFKAGLPAFNRTSVNDATKAVRNAHGWIAECTTAQSLQCTGERLVKAFDAFFRRLAAGETPGYPRFKSIKRFSGWGYKAHADGWKLLQAHDKLKAGGCAGHSYGAVRLSGIGTVSMRGRARFEGEPKTAEVLRRGDKWFLSVTFEIEAHQVQRKGGTESVAFDWGLTTLLTQVVGDPLAGSVETIENPRWLKKQLERLVEVQKAISALETAAKNASGKSKGFPVSLRLKMAYDRRRALHGKVARQRHDFYHQLSARMASRFGLIVTEELQVSNMCRAPKPKPDAANEGQYLPNGASAKAGLNRSILDAAPAGFIDKLRYKAEEAGSKFIEVPTRSVKPTQRCHLCGVTQKLELRERQWVCACGAHHERDVNAPRTMLRYAYEGAWWNSESGTGTVPARFRA